MDARGKGKSTVAPTIWNVCCPIIFTFGMVGNILTIVVLNKNSKKSSTTIYLTGLAVTDLLLVMDGLPRWWIIYNFGYDIRHYSEFVCQLQLWMLYFSGCLSSMFLVALTFERILSTVRPYKVRSICSNRNALVVTGGIIAFIFSLTAHIFYGFHHETVRITSLGAIDNSFNITTDGNCTKPCNESISSIALPDAANDSLKIPTNRNCSVPCDESFSHTNNVSTEVVFIKVCTWTRDKDYAFFYENIFGQLHMIIYNIFPLGVFVIGGTVLIRRLVLSTQRRRNLTQTGTSLSVYQKRVTSWSAQTTQITVMLVTVSLVFFIFTTPSHVFLLGRTSWVDEENGMTDVQEIVWAVVNMLTFTNHSINFILYFLSGARFRKKFFELFRCGRPASPTSTLSLSQIATAGQSVHSSTSDLTSRYSNQSSPF